MLESSRITGGAGARTQPDQTGPRLSRIESSMSQDGAVAVRDEGVESQSCLKPSTKRALRLKVKFSDKPISTKRLKEYLGRLSILDRTRADLNSPQARVFYDEYLGYLADFPEWQIDLGFQHFKRGGSPWMPTPGQFIEHIEAGRREWISG